MKILLTGKDGQVGFNLRNKLSSLGEVIGTSRRELDLSDSDVILALISLHGCARISAHRAPLLRVSVFEHFVNNVAEIQARKH